MSNTTVITNGLATAILKYLVNGGTRQEADLLAETLVSQSKAPELQTQQTPQENTHNLEGE